jgi:YD repeat-containing protein
MVMRSKVRGALRATGLGGILVFVLGPPLACTGPSHQEDDPATPVAATADELFSFAPDCSVPALWPFCGLLASTRCTWVDGSPNCIDLPSRGSPPKSGGPKPPPPMKANDVTNPCPAGFAANTPLKATHNSSYCMFQWDDACGQGTAGSGFYKVTYSNGVSHIVGTPMWTEQGYHYSNWADHHSWQLRLRSVAKPEWSNLHNAIRPTFACFHSDAVAGCGGNGPSFADCNKNFPKVTSVTPSVGTTACGVCVPDPDANDDGEPSGDCPQSGGKKKPGPQSDTVADPVNVSTRDLHEVLSCMGSTAAGVPFRVGIAWSTKLARRALGAARLGGPGWSIGRWQQRLVEIEPDDFKWKDNGNYTSPSQIPASAGGASPKFVTIVDGDGDEHRYLPDADGKWYPPGSTSTYRSARLERDANGNWTRFFRNGEREFYSSYGILVGTQDVAGNQVRMVYSGTSTTATQRLESWPRGATASNFAIELHHAQVTLTADGGATSKQLRLTEIRDAASNRPSGDTTALRSVKLGYDAKGRLVRVTDETGGLHRYEYDDNGLLTKIWKPNEAWKLDSTDAAVKASAKFIENVYDGSFVNHDVVAGTRAKVPASLGATNVSGAVRYKLGSNGGGTGAFVEEKLPEVNLRPNALITSQIRKDGNGAVDYAVLFNWGITADTHDTEVIYKADPASQAVVRTLRYKHDAQDRIVRKYVPVDGVPSATTPFTAYQYDDKGLLVRETDPLGRVTTYGWDTTRRDLTSVTVNRPSGTARLQIAYNDRGQVIRTTSAANAVTHWNYCDSVNTSTGCGAVGALREVVVCGTDTACSATSGGLRTRYTTNAIGQVTRVTNPDGSVVTQTYEPVFGYPQTATFAAGSVNLTKQEVLDWRGYPRRVVDLQGIGTNFVTDAAGRITRVVANVNADGTCTGLAAPACVRTDFRYDRAGNLVRVVRDQGTASTNIRARMDLEWAWTGTEGRYAITRIASGRETGTDSFSAIRTDRIAYDLLGRPTQVTDALGRVSTTSTVFGEDGVATITQRRPGRAGTRVQTYDAAGAVTREIDELGRITGYRYRAQDGLLDRVMLGCTSTACSAAAVTYEYGYELDGRLATTRGPSGLLRTQTYDVYRRSNGYAENGRKVLAILDAMGRVTSSRISGANDDPNTTWVQRVDATYDALGRKTSQTVDPSGLALRTRFEYVEGSESDRLHLRRIIDPRGQITRYRYDAQGKVALVTDPNGTTFDFTYDALGRLLQQGSSVGGVSTGRVQAWTYDALGRTLSATVFGMPSSTRTERWTYRADGSVQAYCPFSGQAQGCSGTVTRSTNAQAWLYAYDGAGRLTSIDYPEVSGVRSADAAYTYTDADELATVRDGRPLPHGSTLAGLSETAYTYDSLGRVTKKVRTPDLGSTAIAPSELGYGYKSGDLTLASMAYRLRGVDRGSVQYGTDALGQITSLRNWAGQTTYYGYAPDGRLATVEANATSATSTGSAFSSRYSYDSARRLSRIQHLRGSSNLLDLNYAPTGTGALGALRGRDANGSPQSIVSSWGGGADLAGALVLTDEFRYDALGRITNIVHAAIPAGGDFGIGAPAIRVTNTYDAVGNATSMMGRPLAYDEADRISSPGFGFDANGNMTASASQWPDACAVQATSADLRVRCFAGTGSGFQTTNTGKVLATGNWSAFAGQARFADVDGDGRGDVCVTRVTNTGPFVHCAIGDGQGSFGALVGGQLGTANVTGWATHFADLDGDRREDVCFTSTSATGVAVRCHRGNGNGTFQANAMTGALDGADLAGRTVHLDDLDGDGRADLCAVSFGASGSRSACALGNGSGGFGARVDDTLETTDVTGWTSHVTDVDADGVADLCLVTTSGGLRARCHRGNANGTFGTITEGTGADPAGAAVRFTDVDGDGRADLCAFAATGTGLVSSCQLGQRTGGFSPTATAVTLATTSYSGWQPVYGLLRGDHSPLFQH